MSIQRNINAALGTAAGAATMGKHISEQAKANDIKITELEAEQAANVKEIEGAKTAYANDLKEAQQAILAHAEKEGLSEEEIKKLEEDPEYANIAREKLKATREKELEEAGNAYKEAYKKLGEEPKQESDAIKLAYARLRETNQRIATTNQLKFDVESRLAKQDVLAKKLNVLK